MQEKGCVSPALVISIMETQHFTAFSLYAAEVNYERFLKFCFYFSTWNANSRLGNVNSTFSLSHKEGAELKKQHKVESWEVELHTQWLPPACLLARTVIFKTTELKESAGEGQDVQTILLAAGTTIKRN